MFGAAPSLLERVVPSQLDGDFNIKGYTIPSGTVVSTQAWSVHRVPEVFPDPDAFKPERWLAETDEMRVSSTNSNIWGHWLSSFKTKLKMAWE